jgi:hypothetical protein
MSEDKPQPRARPEDEPDERGAESEVEDLDVPEGEAHHVKGGLDGTITARKAGKGQQEYY